VFRVRSELSITFSRTRARGFRLASESFPANRYVVNLLEPN
jgi:hypothetical protein